MLVSQSDLIEFDLWESASYLHKIDVTAKSNKTKVIKHNILYSMNFPYGIIGLKYAVGGKLGGYVSSAYSIDYTKFTYLTGGILIRISSNMKLCAGTGLGPKSNYYNNYYYGNGYKYIDGIRSFVFESSVIYNLKKFSLDAGLGYNLNEGLYSKIGFGINF
ncbi:MAG: hypothetical protein PHE33_12485 [Bacteroidales bacterium]|nr:hypothetical protein [Bacteroidales bacterium]